MTFPGGTHDVWIRYWLAAAGIDPDNDVDTIVVPPPQMVANMKVDTMDAFCVGEPWNAQLVNQGIGFTALDDGRAMAPTIRKRPLGGAGGLDREESQGEPKALTHGRDRGAALVRQSPGNRKEKCKRTYVQRAADEGSRSTTSRPHLRSTSTTATAGQEEQPLTDEVLARSCVLSVPEPRNLVPRGKHALGQLPPRTDLKALIKEVNREDIWRDAAKELRVRDAEIRLDFARGGDVLRRQGVRSGKPLSVSGSPCRSSVLRPKSDWTARSRAVLPEITETSFGGDDDVKTTEATQLPFRRCGSGLR